MHPVAVLLVAVVLIMVALSEALFLRLKRKFPDDWERLGKPDVFLNNNLDNTVRSFRYLWSDRHRNQGGVTSFYVYLVRTLWFLAVALLVFSLR